MKAAAIVTPILVIVAILAATPRDGSARSAATAVGSADTVYVWTVDPDQYDPSYLARNNACGLFDARRGRAMVFAGGEGISHPGGTSYSQSGTTVVRAVGDAAWTPFGSPLPGFALVDEACAVYDSVSDTAWMFGGRHYTNSTTSTYGWTTQVVGALWRLDVAAGSWMPIAAIGPAPQPRTGATLVLDPANRRLWLFGGADSLNRPLGDLWSMDLATPGSWTSVTPSGASPGPRTRALAAYDPGGSRMLVSAGVNGTTALTDTWALALSGPPSWELVATSGPAPAGRLVGAFDPARNRLLGGGNGDGAIYSLDLASGQWSAHSPVGSGQFSVGSAAILDPGNDVLVSAWSGFAVVSGGSPFTPPTAFLRLGSLQPTVHLSATLTGARFHRGVSDLTWSFAFDHPLWAPAVLESTSLGGITGAIHSVQPDSSGSLTIGIGDPSLAGDSLRLHFRWFDGTQQQVTPDTLLRFAPAPLLLHISPDTLWLDGSDLHVWFHVPDDSARYLVDQTLERRDNGGPWNFRERGFSDDTGVRAFVEVGVLPFTRYEYRITWLGPDGLTHASPSFGIGVTAQPVFADSVVTPDSVVIRWSTKAGFVEIGRVAIRRGGPGAAWTDTIAVVGDPAGILRMRDSGVSPDAIVTYRLQWFDGSQWTSAPDLAVHVPAVGSAPPLGPAFALGRAQPDPASIGFDLPLTLGGAGITRIELFDLAGRRRWSGIAVAGAAVIHVETGGLENGVYLVRGVHAGMVRTGRVAVVH